MSDREVSALTIQKLLDEALAEVQATFGGKLRTFLAGAAPPKVDPSKLSGAGAENEPENTTKPEPKPKLRLVKTPEPVEEVAEESAPESSDEATGGDATPEYTDIEAKVIEAVRPGGVSRGDIAAALGVTPESIAPVIVKLRTQGAIGMTGVKRGARYHLPGAAEAQTEVVEESTEEAAGPTKLSDLEATVLSAFKPGESLSRATVAERTGIDAAKLTQLFKRLREQGKLNMEGSRSSAVYTLA